MTVTSVVPDRDAQTLVLTADYAAEPAAVWRLWSDPRLLERWWGPPAYPAAVDRHDLTPGGVVTYVMTGPDGQRFAGWWRVTAVDAPTSLAFDDGFGDVDAPADLPVTRTQVSIADRGDGTTRMVLTSRFASPEAFDQLIAMGMQEGLTEAVGQTDALLAQAGSPA